MFAVRGDSPYQTIQDLVGQADRVRRQGLRAFRSCRATSSTGIGLKQDEDFKSVLSRSRRRRRRRWCWMGGSRRCGAPASAIPDSPTGEKPGGRPVHRTDGRRDRAHRGQAPLSQADDRSGRQLSEPDRADQFAGVLELHSGAGRSRDEVAYRLARTLHGAEGAFCKKLAQACETTAANTVAAVPGVELIHPGVMKYFREIGVVK